MDGDQGAYLFLGTLRGPSPKEVREIDALMDRAFAKGKESSVARILKDTRRRCENNRKIMEWVEVYIKRKWDLDLFGK